MKDHVKMFPTPATRDYKGARKPETLEATGRNPETNSLGDAIGEGNVTGSLNPDWVELLMGFPVGFTDMEKPSIDKLATQNWQGDWEAGVPRVATGVKNRVGRLKCLGNAVVPQVVEMIGRAIVEVESNNSAW